MLGLIEVAVRILISYAAVGAGLTYKKGGIVK
jgi:hypothetical protein